jgi:hypothetical protein
VRGFAVFLSFAVVLVLADGCSHHDDCASLATCETNATIEPFEAGANDAATPAKAYPPVPPPPGCVVTADPASAPLCLDESYALFVDAEKGRDENPGTKAAPLQTLRAATDLDRLAGRRRIYVSTAPQSGNFVLPIGVSLAGGFSNTDWGRPLGQTTTITGAAGSGPTLSVLASSEDVVLSDLVITSAASTGGDSSIGVFVASKTATLYRSNIHAGSAGDGQRPESQSNRRKEDGSGVIGATTANACTCSLHGTTTGGAAGDYGQPGAPGTSDPPATIGGRTGAGGSGSCTDGQPGGDGAAGAGGSSVPVVGVIDASGWHGSNGQDGAPGEPGGGGGGAGNHGGSGGCGGCGGAGGRGGVAGGSSLGLMGYQSVISLIETTIVTEAAGRGGNGGQGEAGQVGGDSGGTPCKGGTGGTGGGGGGGGGGAAGLSAPIVRTGGDLKLDAGTKLTPGKNGIHGDKGPGGVIVTSPTLGPGQGGHDGIAGADPPSNDPIIVLH